MLGRILKAIFCGECDCNCQKQDNRKYAPNQKYTPNPKYAARRNVRTATYSVGCNCSYCCGDKYAPDRNIDTACTDEYYREHGGYTPASRHCGNKRPTAPGPE